MPLVSVVMTAYNNARHIEAAVASVLSQDFGDYELIVVEDAGSDATYELASQFSDRRLSVFRNDRNLGQHRNKNAGLARARGRLVKFVDGDDILEPGGLGKLVEAFESYGGGASAIFGRTRVIDDEGDTLRACPAWGIRGLVSGKALLQHLASNIGFGGCPFGNPTGHLFTRTVLDVVGGFPDTNTYAGDCETFFKVLAVSDVAFTDEIVAAYRRQPSSLSATTSALRQLQDAFVSVDSLQRFFPQHHSDTRDFGEEGFQRGILAAFTKHLVATQALRMRLGRPNYFNKMADLFQELGYAQEWRYLLRVETPRYFLAVAIARLRAGLGLAPCSTFSVGNKLGDESRYL